MEHGMQLNTYLLFNGQCEEAFQFYAKCFGGEIESMFPYAGSPMEKSTPPELLSKIMHATLSFDGQVLMGADVSPADYKKPQGFSATLNLKDAAIAERIFRALTENGTVTMALQETFWAGRFGMAVDRFGIPWMVNCEKAA
jgi:PhnB protein